MITNKSDNKYGTLNWVFPPLSQSLLFESERNNNLYSICIDIWANRQNTNEDRKPDYGVGQKYFHSLIFYKKINEDNSNFLFVSKS